MSKRKATFSSIGSVRAASTGVPSQRRASSCPRNIQTDLAEIKWFLGALSSLAALVKVADHLGDTDNAPQLLDWSGISDLTEQMISCAYLGGLNAAIECLRTQLTDFEQDVA